MDQGLFRIRNERYHSEQAKANDERSPSERDYDRILYSSAFLRLAGVAQVAHTEDHCIVHNRLIHSLKVARIGRGLAVRMCRDSEELLESVGGVDPSVVEAAALAHDLGHPPFGHIAEEELNSLVHEQLREFDAFEGNAQSFRVVTKLASRDVDYLGLNLTRATLDAIQKYPWHRGAEPRKRRKWGAYCTESDIFEWTRQRHGGGEQRSAEAELMDWADDVAYATHDVEDYYRVGLLPLDRLLTDAQERERFLRGAFERWRAECRNVDGDEEVLRAAFDRVAKLVQAVAPAELKEPYAGGRRQRAAIHTLISMLINRFLNGIRLRKPDAQSRRCVACDSTCEQEILMLKELIWHYVIRNASLAALEYGQRKVIRDLFQIFRAEADSRRPGVFSHRYREQLEQVNSDYSGTERTQQQVRVIVDIIAEMTEHRAYEIHKTLTGYSPASVLDYAGR